MLSDLFGLFNSVLFNLPDEKWFVFIIASACIFGIGCLIKFILLKEN